MIMKFEIKETGNKKILIVYNDSNLESKGYILKDKELYELFCLLREIYKNN